MYNYRYDAPPAVELAALTEVLTGCGRNDDRGLDHGVWVPLMAMYPRAAVPVAVLSVSPSQGARAHFELGERLSRLPEEGILLVASGSLVHGLNTLNWQQKEAEPEVWAREFLDDLLHCLSDGDWDALFGIAESDNYSVAHPTSEHLLPLYVLAGLASVKQWSMDPIAEAWRYANLSMHSVRCAPENSLRKKRYSHRRTCIPDMMNCQ